MKPVKVLSYGFCVWLPWLFDQGSFLFVSSPGLRRVSKGRSLFPLIRVGRFRANHFPLFKTSFRATAGFIISHWEDLEIRGRDPDLNTFRLIRALWSELTTGETTDNVF